MTLPRLSPLLTRSALRLGAALTFAASALLAACGSGSTFQPFVPKRVVAFGDGFSDLGQVGGNRYTVNDGSVNIWTQRVAASYGLGLTASASGGKSYAAGGARINGAGNSIEQQITSFLAVDKPISTDLVLVDAGVEELATLAQQRKAGTLASDAALTAAAQASGRALATQLRRLSTAGGTHIVVANSYDFSKSPFASTNAMASALSAAVRAYNDSLKIDLADLGNVVLLVDTEAYVNTIYTGPAGFLGAGATTSGVACSTPTALTCTASTLSAAAVALSNNYNLMVYADDRFFTPNMHRLLGDNAKSKISNRW